MAGCSSGGLPMSERVQATRAGLYIALVFTLPIFAWLLGQSFLPGTGPLGVSAALGAMMATLLLLQSGALAVCLPSLLRFSTALDRCCGIAMIVLVPAPLYALCWQGGGGEWPGLVMSMTTLVGFAAVLYGLFAVCLILTVPGGRRSFLLLAVQLVLLVLCWNFRSLWQQVLQL